MQFNPDGEGLDFTDMQNMQTFAQARNWIALFTHALANAAGDPSAPGDLDTPEAFAAFNELSMYGGAVIALHPGTAWVGAGGANQLAIFPGSIGLVMDEPFNTGDDFGLFRVTGVLALATAVGAAQPRIDIVEVKLTHIDGDPQDRHFEDATTREPSTQSTSKEKQLQLTYQIKAGTPAANPTYPTPSAGFTAMAAVYVPALHNAVHSPTNIRDLRMPVGVRCVDVDAKAMFFTGANPWAVVDGMIAGAAAASDPDADRVIAPCPISTKSARLLAVAVHGFAFDPRCEIGRLDYPTAGGAATFTKYGDLVNVSGDMLQDNMVTVDGMSLADEIADVAVIRGVRAAGERVGTALWCNGYAGGMAHPGVPMNDGAEATVSKLAISIGGANGSRVGLVRFWIAEGL
ncbi:MAG TPA: hypothetical protein VMZ53_03515 [Kofleriaceae bacterium]|nr:hypothetical protein [Kofleriaceae bacterium]